MILRIIFSISVIAAILLFLVICLDKMTFLIVPGQLIQYIFYVFLIFLFLGLAIYMLFPNIRKSYKYTNQLRSFFKSDESTELQKLLSTIKVKVKKKNVVVEIKAPMTLEQKKEFEKNEKEIISSIIEQLDPFWLSDCFIKSKKKYQLIGGKKNG